MMTTQDRNILATYARRLRDRLPDAEVFAFGSRVSGTADTESDLDICVVVPRLDHAARELIRDIAWSVGFESDVVITTVKYDTNAFRYGPVSESPLVQTILAEGMAA